MRPRNMRSLAYRLAGTKDVYVIHPPDTHEAIDKIIFKDKHPVSVFVQVNKSTGDYKIIHNQLGSRR